MTKVRTEEQLRARRWIALIAAALVGLVVVIGVVWSLAIAASDSSSPQPTESAPGDEESLPADSTGTPRDPQTDVVDPTVTEIGLVAQPITSDLKTYATEAAKAVVTVDATKVDRKGFMDYIAGWVGYDQRYGTDIDELERIREVRLDEIYSEVIGDTARWDSLARDESVLVAEPTGTVKVDYDHVSIQAGSLDESIAGGLHTVTVDLAVETTAEQSGNPIEVTDPLSITMQIQCDGSFPVPPTPQKSGDCTVIRYFSEVYN